MRVMAMEEAMAGLPVPGEGRVKYLVDTFKKLLSLGGSGGGLTMRNKDVVRRRRRKEEATVTAMVSLPCRSNS
jgi:hypothetical protein